jgi:hypothetical protein
MAFLTYADRVAETTTTTGTGTIQLAGAVDAKFRTFVAGVGSGATVPYVVVHRTANEWEVGYGVVTAGSPNTLTRAGIYSSSNSNNAVNLSTGTKDVFLSLPGSKTVRFDDATGGLAVDGTTLVVDATNDRVGIGTASPGAPLHVAFGSASVDAEFRLQQTTNGTASQMTLLANNDTGAGFNFIRSQTTGGTEHWRISGGATTGTLVFATNGNTERARITSGGYLKASNDGTYLDSTGTYHEFRTNTADTGIAVFSDTSASPYGFSIQFPGAAPNNTTNFFVRLRDNAAGGTDRLFIYSNGTVQNATGTYGTLSDEKLKQDIVDAGSQWDDLKAVRFRKYRFISDVEAKGEDAPVLLGVVAQELALTSPGLVDEHPDMEAVEVPVLDEDGNETGETRTEQRPTGTFTKSVKSSILLMKAAVALQEAMTRIEALETRLAALEGE